MSLTLAIDTATEYLVLGLESGTLGLERQIHLGRAHAEHIALEVKSLFDTADLEFGADRIVLGLGPGSYTGLRVGASYALGLARAWKVPVLGVSTLEGMVARSEGRVAVALEARKGNVYGGIYQVESGEVVEVLLEEDKFERSYFLERSSELEAVVLEDAAPSGLGLIRVVRSRGREHWKVKYL